MKISILLGIREVVYEMTDGDKVRKEPIPNGKLAKKGLSVERIEFLSKFVDLLLNTDFINERTKTYLLDKDGSYKTIAEKISEKTGKHIGASTLQSTVWLDKNRIEGYFTSKFLLDIIEYTNTDVSVYMVTLQELLEKYGNASLISKNIIIKLPTSEAEYKEFNDNEFNEFIDMITPYIKSQADYVRDGITPSLIGYCKYILNCLDDNLSNVDKKRKELLLALLS